MERKESISFSVEIQSLYRALNSIAYTHFYELESNFCLCFSSDRRKAEFPLINTFLVVSNWQATSFQSGVWTYYEATDPQMIKNAVDFLKKKSYKDLAEIISKGIHDYQNPQYADEYDYPENWIEESEEIDNWINEHEDYLQKWLYDFLLDNKETISGIFKIESISRERD